MHCPFIFLSFSFHVPFSCHPIRVWQDLCKLCFHACQVDIRIPFAGRNSEWVTRWAWYKVTWKIFHYQITFSPVQPNLESCFSSAMLEVWKRCNFTLACLEAVSHRSYEDSDSTSWRWLVDGAKQDCGVGNIRKLLMKFRYESNSIEQILFYICLDIAEKFLVVISCRQKIQTLKNLYWGHFRMNPLWLNQHMLR